MKKSIALSLVGAIIISAIFTVSMLGCGPTNSGTGNLKTYQVKIKFCDGRPPEWKTLVYDHKPSTADIKVDGRAVPVLYETTSYDRSTEKFINVCDVEVL